MKLMRIGFWTLVASVFCVSQVSAQTLVLNSFESSSDLAQVAGRGATFAQTTQDVTNGKDALKVAFKSSSWPCICLYEMTPWNLSEYGGLAFDVSNPAATDQNLYVQIGDTVDDSDATWSAISVPAGQTISVAIPLSSGYCPEWGNEGMVEGPPAFPGFVNEGWSGSATFNDSNIYQVWFYLASAVTSQTLIFDNVRAVTGTSPTKIFSSFIDNFGQFNRMNWPNKVLSTSGFATFESSEQADLASNPAAPTSWDSYGGWSAGPTEATSGYFGTKEVSGKWWLVDPAGKLFFSTGLDEVSDVLNDSASVTGRTSMFSTLPTPVPATTNYYASNLATRYGANYQAIWQAKTVQRMKSWGFNSFGAWPDSYFVTNSSLPYVVVGSTAGTYNTVNTGNEVWAPTPDPFDPAFATATTANIAAATLGRQTDKMLTGYFVDNELSWFGTGTNYIYGVPIAVLAQTYATSPAKQAFIAQLQSRHSSIATLNSSWGTAFTSWSSLYSAYTVPATVTSGQLADLSAYLTLFATQYFKTVRSIVKAADPNHLYLGTKMAGLPPAEVLAAAEAYCDVLSFDLYLPEIDPYTESVLNQTGKPCLIAEFSIGSSTDSGMFYGSLVPVTNQEQRAEYYTNYAISAVTCPSLVGCHWFQYTDEPIIGRMFDGENGNLGFVTNTDTVYQNLVSAARDVNSNTYAIRNNMIPVSISVLPVAVVDGQTAKLTATLVPSATSADVQGQTLTFSVDGTQVGAAATGSTGAATVTFPVSSSYALGAHSITVSYSGNGTMSEAYGTGTLTATLTATKVALTSVSGAPGSTVMLSAKLTTSAGVALANMQLSFYVANKLILTTTTNVAGSASVSYVIPLGTAAGALAISAAFTGNSAYSSSSSGASLTVS